MSSSTTNNKEILATIDQYETNCKVSRKNLGTQTKAFKKYNNEEKLNKFPALLKLYQKGIISNDNLLRHAINPLQIEEKMSSVRKQPNI